MEGMSVAIGIVLIRFWFGIRPNSVLHLEFIYKSDWVKYAEMAQLRSEASSTSTKD